MFAGDEEDITEETSLLLQSHIKHEYDNKTRNTGGLANKMPTRGYCLVFNKELENKYIVSQNEETLTMTVIRKNKADKSVNLLQNFIETNIKYYIHETESHFFVIIFIEDQFAAEWADEQDFEVPINPIIAIKKGREDTEFDLAHHTYCPEIDEEKSTFELTGIDEPFHKLNIKTWDHIHIPFETSIDQNIYKLPVLNDRFYLTILYDVLTNDYKLSGAQFNVQKKINNSKHALTFCFALHDYYGNDDKHNMSLSNIFFRLTFFSPQTWFGNVSDDTHNGIIDEIRDYYGEYIAFYFLFTVYYIQALYPMCVIGLLWFAAQLSIGDIAIPGSLVGVLIAIIWTTVMLEYWYRFEWKWRVKWGVVSYSEHEVPQPQFKGKYVVSPESGMVVETHKNICAHTCKIIFSLSTMFFFIAIVIALVAGIWILKNRWKNDTQYSILIGVINSIEIQILNAIYTKLAIKLNNFENHRLKLDYYNHLIIKRISFIVINSFNSLFYIAFYEEGYDNNVQRLQAVRIQLLTLFFTAIVIQNSMELGIPAIIYWVKNKYISNERQKQDILLNNLNENKENEIDDIVFNDICDQMSRNPTPSLLDNTAEVVILHGYIILFVVIFPAMPLLALINNYFEIGIDYYNLLHSQRPVPFSSNGIGVWKSVISIFNIVAVFSNIALLTFRTDLISSLVGNTQIRLLIAFFVLCMVLIAFQLILRNIINDQSKETQCAIKRQEQCERYLIRNPVKQIIKTTERKNKIQQL